MDNQAMVDVIERLEQQLAQFQEQLQAHRSLLEEICEYMPRRNMSKRELYELRQQMAFNARSRGRNDGD